MNRVPHRCAGIGLVTRRRANAPGKNRTCARGLGNGVSSPVSTRDHPWFGEAGASGEWGETVMWAPTAVGRSGWGQAGSRLMRRSIVGGFGLQAWEDVGVGVESDVDRGVAEALGDDLGWMPWRSMRVAWLWRRSWKGMRGRLFCLVKRREAEERLSGWMGLPSPLDDEAWSRTACEWLREPRAHVCFFQA